MGAENFQRMLLLGQCCNLKRTVSEELHRTTVRESGSWRTWRIHISLATRGRRKRIGRGYSKIASKTEKIRTKETNFIQMIVIGRQVQI